MQRRPLLLLALLVYLAVALVTAAPEARREIADPGDSDAMAFLAGSHLVLSDPAHLYDETTQRRWEADALGIPVSAGYLQIYNNLPAAGLLISPLSAFDIHDETAGLIVLAFLSLMVAAVCALRLLRGAGTREGNALIVALAVLMLPPLTDPTQWDMLIAAAVFAAMVLAGRSRGRDIVAGILLSAVIIKPQAALLIVPALASARSWRILAGLVLGGLCWLLVSLVIVGVGGFGQMLHLLSGPYLTVEFLTQYMSLPGTAAAITGNATTATVVSVVLIAAAWILLPLLGRRALRGHPRDAIALGVGLSLIVAPHLGPQDYILLAPAAVMAARHGRALLAGLAIFAVTGAWWLTHALAVPLRLETLAILLPPALLVWVLRRPAAGPVAA